MATKEQALDTSRDWPPKEPDLELGSALISLMYDGSAKLGSFLRALMVPQKLTGLGLTSGGTYDTCTLDKPGAVFAVRGQGVGVLAELVATNPTTLTYTTSYDSDGVCTITVLASDGATALDVQAFQLPQEMADVLNAEAG